MVVRLRFDPLAPFTETTLQSALSKLLTEPRASALLDGESSLDDEAVAAADDDALVRVPRGPELLFRYRARNWPESLDAGERERWDGYRRRRLGVDAGLSEYSFDSYGDSIASLRASRPEGPDQALLDALQAWGLEIQQGLGMGS